MENVKMNEKAIIDEQLENVSGGLDPIDFYYVICDACKEKVSKFEIVRHNNRSLCKDCMAKFNK